MCEKININELQNLLEERYRKIFYIDLLKYYPLDGQYLECIVSTSYFKLYSNTSFKITKGSDEAFEKRLGRNKWVLFDRLKCVYKDLDINKVIERFLIEYEKQLKRETEMMTKAIKSIRKIKKDDETLIKNN